MSVLPRRRLPRLLLLGALVAAAAGGAPPAPLAPQATPFKIFRATGVVNTAKLATSVHCSNLSAASQEIRIDFAYIDGSTVCTLSQMVASGHTATLSTALTAAFFEDGACPGPPLLNQGSLLVSSSSPAGLICTVQTLDPVAASPTFLDTLTLYDASGQPKDFWLFRDGFETGDRGRWSAST